MIERRGREAHSGARTLLFCGGCNCTSVFQREDVDGQVKWRCIGDQRRARPHPGCGRLLVSVR